MVLEELQVIVSASIKPMQDKLKSIETQLKGLQASTNKSMDGLQKNVNKATSGVAKAAKALKASLIALGIGKTFAESFNLARLYESSSQQVNRIFGVFSSALDSWIEKNAKTFGMARADAMKYASIYGNLVRSFEQDGAKMTQYTTDLMKATTIIASNTGRTVEDVSARIRSGILGNTEAIEDLSIYAQVAMLKTTNAFKQIANGRSWEQLTFQEQQQIRVMSILEQTSNQFGDSIQNNMNYKLMQLTATLKNVALNIGQAFMPIVSVVVPILNTMANALEVVTAKLATFMNALFGTDFNAGAGASMNASTSQGFTNMGSEAEKAGNAAEKAGKKAKGALMGFDEVNTLNLGKDSGNDSSLSVPGGAVSSPVIGGITEGTGGLLSEKTLGIINSLKESLKPFTEISFTSLSESLNKLKESISPISEALFAGLKWGIDNVIYPLSQWTIEEALPAFFEALAAALNVINPLLEALKPLGEWLWVNFLEPIASWTGDVIIASLNSLTVALNSISAWISSNKELVAGITVTIAGFFAAWKVTELMAFIQMSGGVIAALKSITTAITAGIAAKLADKAETVALTLMYAKDFVVSIAASTAALVKQATQFVANKIAIIASTVAQGAMTAATALWNTTATIGATVTGAFGAAMAFLTSPIGLVVAAIAAVIATVVLLIKNWDTVKAVAIKCWESIVDAWNVASDWFNDKVVEPIKEFFDNLWGDIKLACSNCWDGIVSTWRTVSSWFNTTVIQPVKKAFDTFWNGTKQLGIDTWNGIKDIWNTVKGWFDTTIIKPVSNAFSTMWNGIKTSCSNAFNGIKDVVKTPLNFVIDMINKVIRGLNRLKIDLPDWSWIPDEYQGKSWGIDLDPIPRLARGGIVDGATFMGNYIAGEAGKEMIVPLENTSFVNKLASALGNAVLQAMQFSNLSSSSSFENEGTPVVLQIGEWEIAKAIIPPLKKELRRTGVSLEPYAR